MEIRKTKERVKEIDEAIRRRLVGLNRDALNRAGDQNEGIVKNFRESLLDTISRIISGKVNGSSIKRSFEKLERKGNGSV